MTVSKKGDVAILTSVRVKWLHFQIPRDVPSEPFPKAVPGMFLASRPPLSTAQTPERDFVIVVVLICDLLLKEQLRRHPAL